MYTRQLSFDQRGYVVTANETRPPAVSLARPTLILRQSFRNFYRSHLPFFPGRREFKLYEGSGKKDALETIQRSLSFEKNVPPCVFLG